VWHRGQHRHDKEVQTAALDFDRRIRGALAGHQIAASFDDLAFNANRLGVRFEQTENFDMIMLIAIQDAGSCLCYDPLPRLREVNGKPPPGVKPELGLVGN
jgi:hypothetical protein